jgi:hypothetical protein
MQNFDSGWRTDVAQKEAHAEREALAKLGHLMKM